MNKKLIFLVLSLIISSCSSGNENTIDELEEQIVVLENKEDLTPEEEEELEELIEEQEQLVAEEELSNLIYKIEEKIQELEEKGDLTPEEEAELEWLRDELQQLEDELSNSIYKKEQEEQVFGGEETYAQCLERVERKFQEDGGLGMIWNERFNCAKEEDKRDPVFSKYYTVGEPDPEFNPGKFLPRHCVYIGEYNGEYYEEVALLEVPSLHEDLDLDYYTASQGLYAVDWENEPDTESIISIHPLNIEDYKGEYGISVGQIDCVADWWFEHGIGGDGLVVGDEPEASLQKNFYGLSSYTRVSEFYTTAPGVQQGVWGQWIQAPFAHPYGPGGGTIEGGYGVYEKFGRSKYPTYMSSGANLFYNANSTYSGWGFYEVRCSCGDFGGVQLTNKVLNSPNSLHFDEDQNEYAEDGGIYFGHGWFALPIFSGEERPESYLLDDHTDRGKLTWTFVSNSAQYSGPMWAYVPEFWIRNIDEANSWELLVDGVEEGGGHNLDRELREKLYEYIAGRYDSELLNDYIKSLEWYVDNADDYDYESINPWWTEEKNTLAYRSTNHAAIGAEMYELPIFTEYDENGDLYIKIFPTTVPSLKEKEYFTLDSRSYGVGVYNNFVDFFNGNADIEDVDTNIKKYSTPLFVETYEPNPQAAGLKQGDLFVVGDEPDVEKFEHFQSQQLIKWNLWLHGETKNGQTNTYWDWSGTPAEQRQLSQYYKVIMPGGAEDYLSYSFTPVNESQVPESLQMLEMQTLERGNSYMPHIKSNSDKVFEEEIKTNVDQIFNVDSTPYDYSCFDCDNGGCDTTVYETTLDDGSMIKYRWYRFRDQPTFKYLSIDYPEIYTEEYLDFLQLRIEKMHREWGDDQDFLAKPEAVDNFHLVELDNGLVVEPPPGKEFGWVPIVIEVEIPYGKYVTRVNYGDLYPDDINELGGWARVVSRVSSP